MDNAYTAEDTFCEHCGLRVCRAAQAFTADHMDAYVRDLAGEVHEPYTVDDPAHPEA